MAAETEPLASVVVASLAAHLPPEGFSPGGWSATRAVALSASRVALASHARTVVADVGLPGDLEARLRPGRGLRVAAQLEAASVAARVTETGHATEIQSLAAAPDGRALLTIDAQGGVRRTPVAAADGEPAAKRARAAHELCAPQTRDAGWAGVDAHPRDGLVATALQFARTVRVLDGETGGVVRELRAQYEPTQVAFGPLCVADTALLVCERNEVAVYDVRAPQACVARVRASWEPVRGLSVAHGERNVLVACEDRRVASINAATWTQEGCWRAPLKYRPVAVLGSRADPLQCYAAGLDNELLCGDWGGDVVDRTSTSKLQQNFTLGFRARSRWVGVSLFAGGPGGGDVVFGATECGWLYRVGHAERMHPLGGES